MAGRRVLVTGGAGFVGANLALTLAAELDPDWELTALDNLRRRGSELNLPRLREAGVRFVHGDVRELDDLLAVDEVDAIVECSAEPSALAGRAGDTSYVVGLEPDRRPELPRAGAPRRRPARVPLHQPRLPLRQRSTAPPTARSATRFELEPDQELPGISDVGRLRGLPARRPAHPLRRHQAGRRAAHRGVPRRVRAPDGDRPLRRARRPLADGQGRSGRVHALGAEPLLRARPELHRLRRKRKAGARPAPRVRPGRARRGPAPAPRALGRRRPPTSAAGAEVSLSLLETTEICRELTGHDVAVGSADQDRPGDVRIYLSDCERLAGHTDWQPRRGPREVLEDIFTWVNENERAVRSALG